MLHIARILFLQFLIIQNGDSLQHIFPKSFSSAEKENFSDEVHFDPKKNIFPVIRHLEHCSQNLTFCPVSLYHHMVYQITCNFENLCPNGTRPQCVENKEYVWTLRGILWICSPFRTCDRGKCYKYKDLLVVSFVWRYLDYVLCQSLAWVARHSRHIGSALELSVYF